ncbi:MAG TPA: dTDP-glucose 4,6-dehydratase [Terriglobia bacterium]|nr:dTDP-glucose 4,6-dehydratase [Terriglobia bacterium]
MRVLVTGGAGFIGSNFIRAFLCEHPDSSVVNLDKLTYAGNLDNLNDLKHATNYQFIQGDVADAEVVNGILNSQTDAVVHFAAETHVDRSITGAGEFVRTNVLGTATLLDTARRRHVGRFLHVSTDEVYGSMAPYEVASEQSPLEPNSPYAASKAASDLLARSYWQTYRFPTIITRCSNNYGPYQFPEKLIPLMISNALEGKRLPVYGDGLNERDWIYVTDHCRALDCVLTSGRPGEVYNIASGRSYSNLEIVTRLLRLLNKPFDLVEFVSDRPGHDRRYALDANKLARELDWQPQVGLDNGLRETVNWYCSRGEWVAKTRTGEYWTYYERQYVKRRETFSYL